MLLSLVVLSSADGSRHLNEVKGYVRELQSWGLLRRIIMRDRVSEDLEEREKKLDAFRLIFLVSASETSFPPLDQI
jgi:hypothetical protein